MKRRYIATYEYTEIVRGQERDFLHETIIEVTNQDAYRQAVDYFERLSMQSDARWLRVLRSCKIAEAPGGAVAKGGKRVYREGELET